MQEMEVGCPLKQVDWHRGLEGGENGVQYGRVDEMDRGREIRHTREVVWMVHVSPGILTFLSHGIVMSEGPSRINLNFASN